MSKNDDELRILSIGDGDVSEKLCEQLELYLTQNEHSIGFKKITVLGTNLKIQKNDEDVINEKGKEFEADLVIEEMVEGVTMRLKKYENFDNRFEHRGTRWHDSSRYEGPPPPQSSRVPEAGGFAGLASPTCEAEASCHSRSFRGWDPCSDSGVRGGF